MSIKVLELFAGIGACSSALDRLGIQHEIVDAVEIDKYAMMSFNALHETNFETQDITKWDKDLEVDLIMHGSPCQDFSLAGKQAGGDINSGTRSSLMYETIRIVGKLRPKYVIWENVKNVLSTKHRHNFDNYLTAMESLGYTNYYEVLNAKDFGIPQNRERVFVVSILGNKNYEFPNGNECGSRIERLFNFSARNDCRVVYDKDGLAPTLVAGMGEGGGKVPMIIHENAFEFPKGNIKECEVINPLKDVSGKSWQFEQNVYSENSILRSLKAGGGSGNIPKIIEHFEFPPKQELKLRLKDILEDEVDEKYYLSDEQVEKIKNSNFMQEKKRIQEKEYCDTLLARDWKDPKCVQVGILDIKGHDCIKRVYSDDGLSPTLTGMQGGNTQPKVIIGSTQKHAAISNDGIVPTLTSAMGQGGGHVPMHNYDLRIRKLTPKECWRLMGFNDEEFSRAEKLNSNTQLYKQAGNSIVVNVLVEILKELLEVN